MRRPIDLKAAIVRIRGRETTSAGTGFFVGAGGILLTCRHVLEHAEFVAENRVRLASPKLRTELYATVVCSDRVTDTAVLQLDGSLPDEVIPLELGAGLVANGSPILSFGFPPQYASDGIPGEARIVDETDFEGQTVFVFQSEQFTKGFSGAPALDKESGLVL